jgi:hypothetical protein
VNKQLERGLGKIQNMDGSREFVWSSVDGSSAQANMVKQTKEGKVHDFVHQT